jgi:MerR family transcriptional regulator, heat shock protein HspR
MPEQITPYIEPFYEDAEIWPIIHGASYWQQQFQQPDILHNTVVVVLPMVRRQPGYQPHQFDLYLFINHHQVTDLEEMELYRVKDFIRPKEDVAPLMQALQQLAGVDTTQVLESIKRPLQFRQRPENQDLPVAPAQMINTL